MGAALARELVYAWADGIYVKAGLEKDKAALLVVIGAIADGTKEVLAVAPGFRESAESWAPVLRGHQQLRHPGPPGLEVLQHPAARSHFVGNSVKSPAFSI